MTRTYQLTIKDIQVDDSTVSDLLTIVTEFRSANGWDIRPLEPALTWDIGPEVLVGQYL